MFWESEEFEPFREWGLELWAEMVRQFYKASDWVRDLGVAEQTLGICIFTIFLIYLIFNASRRDKNPGSNSRQFSGALFLVIVIAFGVSWSFELTAGSLAWLFEI
ncbi:MAG: hypothetical protein AAFO63_08935 [Pseudomonadota bacterium]